MPNTAKKSPKKHPNQKNNKDKIKTVSDLNLCKLHLSDIAKVTGLSESYVRHLFIGHTKSGYVEPLKAIELLSKFYRQNDTKQELERKKLLLLEEQVKLKELERRKKEGELVELEKVAQAWASILGIVKDRLWTAVQKLPPILAELSPEEIQEVLRQEVSTILTDLQKDITNEIQKID